MVELGAFCGASTCCLAAGLRGQSESRGPPSSIPMTRFIANEPYLVDFIRTQFGEAIEMGQSFDTIFRRATAEFADLIEVHAGDLLEQTWPSEVPIEILFVDVAKTLALSGKVLTEFFPHLIPGKSTSHSPGFLSPYCVLSSGSDGFPSGSFHHHRGRPRLVGGVPARAGDSAREIANCEPLQILFRPTTGCAVRA